MSEAENKTTVSNITPALSSQVSFDEQLAQVQSSLTSRTQANAKVKEAYAAYASFIEKNSDGHEMPIRRIKIEDVNYYLKKIEVVTDNPEAKKYNPDLKLEYYHLDKILEDDKLLDFLEKKQPGITKTFTETANTIKKNEKYQYVSKKIVDKSKTEAAREQARKLGREYIDAVIALEETSETMSSVKDYIDVVKDIASISAIANGNVAKQKK